jgi:predicted exporter
MNLRRLIGRLLAVFVIVGLVAAPLVTPAAAKRLPAGEMSDMSAMSGACRAVRTDRKTKAVRIVRSSQCA